MKPSKFERSLLQALANIVATQAYGFKIREEAARISWRARISSIAGIHKHLLRLEETGLVHSWLGLSTRGNTLRYYELTANGRDFLERIA